MVPPDVNLRHTGARKLEAHPEIVEPDPVHTVDRSDEPKIPYGLTESLNDRGAATRHHDGKRPEQPDAEAADPGRAGNARRPG